VSPKETARAHDVPNDTMMHRLHKQSGSVERDLMLAEHHCVSAVYERQESVKLLQVGEAVAGEELACWAREECVPESGQNSIS
jgi:hypothetical protein